MQTVCSGNLIYGNSPDFTELSEVVLPQAKDYGLGCEKRSFWERFTSWLTSSSIMSKHKQGLWCFNFQSTVKPRIVLPIQQPPLNKQNIFISLQMKKILQSFPKYKTLMLVSFLFDIMSQVILLPSLFSLSIIYSCPLLTLFTEQCAEQLNSLLLLFTIHSF